MPVKVIRRGDVYRLVEADTGLIAGGRAPLDGGGHDSRAAARAQAAAINASKSHADRER